MLWFVLIENCGLDNSVNCDLIRARAILFELVKSNSQVASGSVPKNPGQIRQTKKTIARIITILNNTSFFEPLWYNIHDYLFNETLCNDNYINLVILYICSGIICVTGSIEKPA